MKKTEKVEIRVSPEEKQKVMDLARADGRSVSELIRSIVNDYVAARKGGARKNSPRIQNLMTSKKTWGVASLAASLTAALVMVTPAQADATYGINILVADTDAETRTRNVTKWTTNVVASLPDTEGFTPLPNHGSVFEVSLRVHEQVDGRVFAHFKICRRVSDSCEHMAEPSLTFLPSEGGQIMIGDVVMDPDSKETSMLNGIQIDIAEQTS